MQGWQPGCFYPGGFVRGRNVHACSLWSVNVAEGVDFAAVCAVVQRLVALLNGAGNPEIGDGAHGVYPYHVAIAPAAPVGCCRNGHVGDAALPIFAPGAGVGGGYVLALLTVGAPPYQAPLFADQFPLVGAGVGAAQHPAVGVAALVSDRDQVVDQVERGGGFAAHDAIAPGAVPARLVPSRSEERRGGTEGGAGWQ